MLSRGSSAKWRSPKALIPSLKDSSEPAESRITRTPCGRLRDEAAGQRQQGDDRGAVVVGAGDDLARADVGHRRDRAEAEEERRAWPAGACRSAAPSAASSGPPTTGAISGGLVSVRLDQAEAVGDLRDRGVEDEARSGRRRGGR